MENQADKKLCGGERKWEIKRIRNAICVRLWDGKKESEREREREELVCNLWVLPIRCHHLSQGLMTAPDHVIAPCDPAILWRNYWALLFYILAQGQKAKATTTQLYNDKGDESAQGQRRGGWILNLLLWKLQHVKGICWILFNHLRDTQVIYIQFRRILFFCATGPWGNYIS